MIYEWEIVYTGCTFIVYATTVECAYEKVANTMPNADKQNIINNAFTKSCKEILNGEYKNGY